MADIRIPITEGHVPAKRRPDPPMYPGGMAIDREEEQAVLEVLRTKRLFRYYGPAEGESKVASLEKAFAQFMGAEYAVAVNSGTSALISGLQGLGVGPGDEVIVPAYTWIASAAAVLTVGAIPVIAEVDSSLTLDPEDVRSRITSYTKAIMPVHMRGAPCDMKSILEIAQEYGLKVLEDTAQADGASYGGRRLGSMGDAGCFSLQFNKIITSGEGGMVVTGDEEVWRRALMFHDVIGAAQAGIPQEQMIWGANFRMPELLAAVAGVQLRRLPELLEAMRVRKRQLKEGIAAVALEHGFEFRKLHDEEGDAAICLVCYAPDAVQAGRTVEALRSENIGAGTLYDPEQTDHHVYAHWDSILDKRAWTSLGSPWAAAQRDIQYARDMCPRSLDWLARAVHIDVSPLLTNEDLEETVEGFHRVLAGP